MRRWLLPGIATLHLFAPWSTAAPPPPRHVVLMVWDGMRPDFIREDLTPNLWALAQRGVLFQRHHPVYLSATEVNGTALATGALPSRSGIMGNREYRPTVNDRRPIDMQDLQYVEKADAQTHGRFLPLPTVAEQVQAQGWRSLVASTKGVGVLQDRPAGRRAETKPPSINLFTQPRADGSALRSVPAGAADAAQAALGAFPAAISFPNAAQDAWTTRAVTEHGWRDGVPAFTMIWLSEPDFTQHQHGLGTAPALAALRSSDRNLGRVVEALKEKGELGNTDLLVVSDHGFSTVERAVNVSAALRTVGFDAWREFSEPPKSGQILVAGNGGSVFLYVIDRDAEMTRRLVEYLQSTDFAGPIFTRATLPGTFSLSAASIDSASAPDVVFSMNWSRRSSELGVPGMVLTDGGRAPGTGTHVSLSAYDMHNTLVAAGPDFRAGFVDELPSGNVDIAPTILHLLGLEPIERMDGRVLREALQAPLPPIQLAPPLTRRIEQSHDGVSSRWRQYLQTTTYDGVTYLDEGGATMEKN